MRTSLIHINPVQNLDLVRSIFFPVPGATLGSGTLHTISQADAYDPAHPEDAAYVENVIWKQKASFSPRSTSRAARTTTPTPGTAHRR